MPESSFSIFDGFLSLNGGQLKGLGLVIISREGLEIFLGMTAPYNGLLYFRTPPGALGFRDPFGMAFLAARAIAEDSRAFARWTLVKGQSSHWERDKS